jgi:hypothetical protein
LFFWILLRGVGLYALLPVDDRHVQRPLDGAFFSFPSGAAGVPVEDPSLHRSVGSAAGQDSAVRECEILYGNPGSPADASSCCSAPKQATNSGKPQQSARDPGILAGFDLKVSRRSVRIEV